ncbi:MAG: DUF4835 family protein [Bacteroidales bacterium]|nr:DUF4835 family protein [Bacteroidales bacterium]
MKLKKVIIALAFTLLCAVSTAQEFRSTVSINYQKLQSTTQSYETADTKIFETMKRSIEDFVNGRRWTNLEFDQNERLDCSISIVLSERTSATDFKGQIQVQLRRPVFNSNYTSGLFNYMESNNFMFSFNESQSLDFDPNTFYDNLSSTLAYYCYIMLGMYFDSFGPNGGQDFYEMARTIAQTASTSGYKGWNSSTDGAKARYWFMENHTNSAYEPLHSVYYYYYRLGLDMMTKDQPTARQNIIQSLRYIQQVHKTRTNVLSVTQFIDVNITEIISIFTPAPQQEQKEVYDIIKEVSPINVAKMKDWNIR